MIKNSVVRKSLKYVLVPLLILVSGFYVYIESQAVDLMMVDGVCTNGIAPLYKASNELSLDELKQKLDIKSEIKDSYILKEFENLLEWRPNF